MRKSIISCFAALIGISAMAADVTPTRTLLLYPEGQQKNIGIEEKGEKITLGPLKDNGYRKSVVKEGLRTYEVGDDARIDIYIPKKCCGKMLVCCPGGGYSFCSLQNEGVNVARWCLDRGIACCVVNYRMPKKYFPELPLHDVQNAFRYCRHHAEEWGVKKIGVIGFSAGGHLAACVSNFWTDSVTRPDFAILIYPVITMDPNWNHGGTKTNITADNPYRMDYYSMEKQVNRNTPPTFLMACQDDATVPLKNSLLYYEKMVSCRVPGEIHCFPTGGHGFGFISPNQEKDMLGAGQRKEFDHLLERWIALQ